MSIILPNVDHHQPSISRLFGRKRPIHEILGGGKAADILLWREKTLSGSVFIGVIGIWYLFEVAEYNLVTLLCHLTITTMLVIFIGSNGAKAFKRTPPNIPTILLEESTLYLYLCDKLNFFMSKLLNIACGNNMKHFCLAILTISLLSTIGNYITTLNLLFIGFLCMGTLPYFYEKHEEEIDYFVDALSLMVLKIYEMFHTNVALKIPRWPLKRELKLYY